MLKITELEALVKKFEKNGRSAEDFNLVRSQIFNALDVKQIAAKTKDRLLKDLYFSASLKNIFFVRVTERKTAELPKTEAEAEQKRLKELEEAEDDYEDSYSYEESYEDDEEADDDEK